MSTECEKQRDIEAAVGACLEGVRLCGPSSELLSTLGTLHLRSGNDKAAFRALSDAQATVGLVDEAAAALCCLKLEKGGVDDALSDYWLLLRSSEAAQTWCNVALCLMLKQRFGEAVGCLEKAVSLDPFDWRIHFNLGCCRLRAGYPSLAIVHLKSATNLEKKRPETWKWLGVALSMLNDTGNAKQAFRNALKLKEDSETHLHFAVMLWNAGDAVEAKKHLSKCAGLEGVGKAERPELTRLKEWLLD